MVPINTRLRAADVEYIFRQSDSSMIITMEQSGPIRYLDMVLDLCPELKEQSRSEYSCGAFPDLKRVLSIGDQHPVGVYSWQEMLDAGDKVSAATLREREAQVKPEDTVFIMYTSGTTGFPKGVMHCHTLIRDLLSNYDQRTWTTNPTPPRSPSAGHGQKGGAVHGTQCSPLVMRVVKDKRNNHLLRHREHILHLIRHPTLGRPGQIFIAQTSNLNSVSNVSPFISDS